MDFIQAVIEKRKPKSLVIMDCPDDLAKLKEVFGSYSFNRVYLMGISPDEAYLNGVGTREQYAKLFKLIHSQERIDIRHKIKAVAQYLRKSSGQSIITRDFGFLFSITACIESIPSKTIAVSWMRSGTNFNVEESKAK